LTRSTLFGVLPCVACLACGGADASKEIETLHSWQATIDLAAEARVKGWVTPRYVAQLRDKARLAVTEGDQAMSKATPAERDSLSAAGTALRASLAQLDRTGR
jgi:hypothetical protein